MKGFTETTRAIRRTLFRSRLTSTWICSRRSLPLICPRAIGRLSSFLAQGRLCKYGNSKLDMTRINLAFRKSVRKGNPVAESFYLDIEMIRRLVFFAGKAGDLYGWDPNDEPKSPGSELPVHELLRLGKASAIVADSFRSFIEDYCLNGLRQTRKMRLSPEHDFDSLVGVYYTASLTPAGRKALSSRAGKRVPSGNTKKRSRAKSPPKK
jgi:hypothetical protein